MRRLRYLVVAFLAAAALSGCHSDIEMNLSNLERRISVIYDVASDSNVNIVQLQSLFNKLNQYDYVQSVSEDYFADVTTYNITFTSGEVITLTCGEDAETPIISIAYDVDGKVYWTVKYGDKTDFLYNEYGEKVLVSAVTPIVRINDDGQWEVSYNDGKTWKNLGVEAKGEDGVSYVKSVDIKDGFMVVTLLSGEVISMPLQESFDAIMEDVKALNVNLQSLKEMVTSMKESFLYVQSVSNIVRGKDTLGFQLNLSDGSSYPFYHGQSTNKPYVSAIQDKTNPNDTAYYWAYKFEGDEDYIFVEDESGSRVRADASTSTIIFRIAPMNAGGNSTYYWQYSNDGGQTFGWLIRNMKTIPVVSVANDAGITSLTHSDGYYILKIFDQTYKIADSPEFIVRFDNLPAEDFQGTMSASDTINIRFTVAGIDSKPEVAAKPSAGFVSWVTQDSEKTVDGEYSGTVTLISPDTFHSGFTKLTVYVSDGRSRVSPFVLKIGYADSVE